MIDMGLASGDRKLRVLRTMFWITATVSVLVMVSTRSAIAYVGASYMAIPGIAGGSKDPAHLDWIAFDAAYWKGSPNMRRATGDKTPTGPKAPEHGAGTLNVAMDKNNPVLARLMDYCSSKRKIDELTFEESADRTRGKYGPRPAGIPEYFQYKLKNVSISDCPVVPDSAWQAVVLDFDDIEWVNYKGHGEPIVFTVDKSQLAVETDATGGEAKDFVLTWFAAANYVGSDQCPKMNSKPSEDAYFTYMTPAEAAAERALLNGKGVRFDTEQMALRGPHKLNACLLPAILPDSGNYEPQSKIAHGFNLDGTEGSDTAKTCGHKKYVSEDGRTGIDNQLFTVQGCMTGLQGYKGFIMQFANNQMHDGLLSILMRVSGVHDWKNDDHAEVSIYYSLDPMVKTAAAGSSILPDYTFRLTQDPQYAHYVTHLHARIVNGVIATDTVDMLRMNLTMYGTPPELSLMDARMRLEIQPDGKLKGVLGGYQDWKVIAPQLSIGEGYLGYNCQGYYYALKRAADGYRDPRTGECTAISSAYDIEAAPAFIASPPPELAQSR